ncbi:DUF4333 domain-containing protein [Saccharopolyspora sp. MS10]|uniref:DUF4333 domain-containing protein n=1 Tax=Saccharopolyspora sp. MS10 TaxID=3385973 RepID=UPI0039A305B0
MTGPYGPPPQRGRPPHPGGPQAHPRGGPGRPGRPRPAPPGPRDVGAAETTHPNLPPITVGPPGRGSAPPPPPLPPRRASKAPWLIGGVVLVAVAGSLAVVGFVHPAVLVHDRFDANSVQHGVARTLERSYHLSAVESVRCPDGQRVVVGSSFDCEVSLPGGRKRVSVTVRDSSGTYEVGYPR